MSFRPNRPTESFARNAGEREKSDRPLNDCKCPVVWLPNLSQGCFGLNWPSFGNLDRFFRFYNEERPHSSFPGDVTPMEVSRGEAALELSA